MANYIYDWLHFPYLCDKSEEFIAHFVDMETQLTAMFECDNMPRDIFRQAERCFFRTGMCGYTVFDDGQHYADVTALSGKIDLWGYGTEGYIIARDGMTQKRGTVGKDIVVGWNNDSRCPTFDLFRYADILSEVDKSMKVTVINSRLHKIPVARNAEQKLMINKVIKNLKNGESESIVNDVSLKDFLDESGALKLDTLTLTDPRDIETIQYLSKYYNDTVARWWQLYGHDMQTTAKMAQQNETELQGIESYSMILPQNMLACRQAWADEINRVFGTDYHYHFSPAWTWALEKKGAAMHVDGVIDYNTEEVEEVAEDEFRNE